eukprot:1134489-Pelagomonas_calceolata.AAC.4
MLGFPRKSAASALALLRDIQEGQAGAAGLSRIRNGHAVLVLWRVKGKTKYSCFDVTVCPQRSYAGLGLLRHMPEHDEEACSNNTAHQSAGEAVQNTSCATCLPTSPLTAEPVVC